MFSWPTKKPGQPAGKGADQKLWSSSSEISKGPKEAFSGKGGKGATCNAGRFGQKLEDFEPDKGGGLWKGNIILKGITTEKVVKREGGDVVEQRYVELDQ